MSRYFAFNLGRSISFRYTTHQWLVLICVLTFCISSIYWTVFEFIKPTVALLGSAMLTLSIFLTWALGREIDPGHQYSAFWGIPLVLFGSLTLGFAQYSIMAFFLLLARLINGTPKNSPTFLDATLLFWFSLPFFSQKPLFDFSNFPQGTLVVLVSLIACIAASFLWLRKLRCSCDDDKTPLQYKRVLFTQWTLVVLSGYYLLTISPNVIAFIPYVAAVLGVSLFHFFNVIKKKLGTKKK